MKTIAQLGLTALVIITLLFSCKKADSTSSAEATDSSAREDRADVESSKSEYSDSDGQQQIQAGLITAGEWNDLSNWSFWESLNENSEFSEMSGYWKYNLKDRISVNVKSDYENVVDVPVLLLDSQNNVIWSSRTNNKGNA